MNRNLTLLLAFMMALTTARSIAQEHFTPYDDLPGVIKSYKPAYSDDFPEWAKMLYQPEINFREISQAFDEYMSLHPGEKSPIIRYFRIWQRSAASFALPDGTIDLPDTEIWYREQTRLQQQVSTQMQDPAAKKELAESERSGMMTSAWTFLGPQETFWLNESGSTTAPPACPWQVNVYSFDVAGSDPSILYCGTETGFVNKTTDKGLTWTQVGIDYPFGGGVTAVAIHPSNPDVVYVSAGNQMHKTTDGGITWIPMLQPGALFSADRLRIHPTNTQKLLAAASEGLFLTLNGGTSWTQKWTAPVYDAEFKPGDPDQVFALTRSGSNFSVIHSADGGQSFQPMTGFPANITESSGGLLAVTPDNPGLLLAILLSANNTPYLVKGTLSGSTWSWSLLATGQTSAFPMNNGQGYFDLVLDIAPYDENLILVGTTTLYKSGNGGTSFTAVGGYAGNFSIHPDIQDIRMLPDGDTWVSTDGGMNLTSDNFTQSANHLVRGNGLMGSDFWGFDQGWNEDILVGGRYHNGNTALSDAYQPKALRMGGAESPTGWILKGRSRHAAFNDLGNGWILPETAEGEPEGRFIFSKYPNMDEYGGRRSNLVHHPTYWGTLFLGEGNGFWKSTDAGVSWELLYLFPARVRYFDVSYHNPEVIYADIVGAGLVKSGDGGITWEQKPSLTAPPYGTANWKGKLFLALSPMDENTLYACLQNGTWSADTGKVFRSADGGDTWTDWTAGLSEYMKCMVIQPTAAGEDIVYLFTNATAGKTSKVWYRSTGMTSWELFGEGYPCGNHVNLAMPFFRDAKLRVAGTGSIWESPMADTAFSPLIHPWTEKAHYACMTDTIRFDDHSILKHAGTSWQWSISPAPLWIEDPSMRNPRVVLGSPGSYDVTLSVTHNGQAYEKTIPDMVTTTTCPSLSDCDNPADLPKEEWSLVWVDSEELNYPGYAVMSFDSDPATIWHTRWSTGSDPYPHEIRIDLGNDYRIYRFTYLPRQDGENGRISHYELYITYDTLNWGDPVSTGQFENSSAPKTVLLDSAKAGRYFRLIALSEVNGNPWASAAEFSLTGCYDWPVTIPQEVPSPGIKAFPVPTTGILTLSLPSEGPFTCRIFDQSGRCVSLLPLPASASDGKTTLDMSSLQAASYLIVLTDNRGVTWRVKTVKTE